MKALSDFIDFIIKNGKTSFGPILSAVVVGLGWFILPRLNNYFNNQKKILIEGSSIFNVDNWNGIPQQLLSEEQYFSNLIFNKLTVNNKRSQSQAVTAIELIDIKVEEEIFSDIQFDGGFYDDKQKFLLIAYNNGNGEGVIPNGILRFIACQSGFQNGELVYKQDIFSNTLASGEIRGLYIKSLNDISKIFVKNTKLSSLKVEFLYEIDSIEKNIILPLIFDRTNGIFRNAPRGAGVPEPENLPVIKIMGDKKRQLVSTSQVIVSGANEVKFLVWVPNSCTLEYKVVLHVGQKRFRSNKRYSFKVRVPIYRQEQGHFLGSFYWLIKQNSLSLVDNFIYNTDDIKLLNSSLIYDKYYAAKKIYNVDFGKIE